MLVVYAKWDGNDGKFHAFDLENGCPVGNIMYASTYRDNEIDVAKSQLQGLCDDNKQMKLQIQLRQDSSKKSVWQSA